MVWDWRVDIERLEEGTVQTAKDCGCGGPTAMASRFGRTVVTDPSAPWKVHTAGAPPRLLILMLLTLNGLAVINLVSTS